jgi:hypothetical protein
MEPLSYEAFIKKHSSKFAGLGKAEKKSRYRSYLQSFAGNERADDRPRSRDKPPKHRPARQILSENDIERVARRTLIRNEYYQAMLNPFGSTPAKVPSLEGIQTSEAQLTWTVPIFSNSDGTAFIAMRPALQGCYSVSDTVNSLASYWAGIATSPLPTQVSAIQGAGSYPAQFPTAAPATSNNAWSVYAWRDVANVDRVLELYTDYIVTAAGYQFNMIVPFDDIGGDAFNALLPGSYGAPFFQNPSFSLQPAIGTVLPNDRRINFDAGSDPNLTTAGLTTDNVETLATAHVVKIAPTMGFACTWHPSSLDAMENWRPTRFMPIGLSSTLDANADTYPSGAGNPYWNFPPCCPGDPATFRAWHNMHSALNPWVAADANAPAGSQFSTLWGAVEIASPAADAAAVATASDAAMQLFQGSLMGDGDNCIVSLLTGLPVSRQVGTVTFTMNITALVESRNFRPVSASAASGSQKAAMHALIAANARPHNSLPPTDHETFKPKLADNLTEGVKAVASTVKTAVSTGQEIFNAVKGVMPIVEDVAATLFAAFI